MLGHLTFQQMQYLYLTKCIHFVTSRNYTENVLFITQLCNVCHIQVKTEPDGHFSDVDTSHESTSLQPQYENEIKERDNFSDM